MIDLHSHSTCSDGSERPAVVVELAAAAGCSAVALTDHDGIDGIGEAAARADELGIELVAGCEVSCAFDPGSMHVLCYFIDGRGPLAEELARLRDDRATRNERLLAKLALLGMPLDAAELADEAGGGIIGRPHIATLLVRHGHASSIDDAFARLLGKGAAAYVSKARVEPRQLVELVEASGGVSSVAHPLSLGLEPDELELELRRLADAGLGGLESYYGRYDEATREQLVRLAGSCGLVATGGSDFHGRYKPDLSMGTGTGDLSVPDEVLVALRERRSADTAERRSLRSGRTGDRERLGRPASP